MAEIGIIASVFGIATAGFKVTQGLYKIADAIGSAGEEVRLLASDSDAFSQMLLSLSEVLKKVIGPSSPSRLIITTEDILRICEQILQPFEKILARLKPLLERFKGSDRKMGQFGLRIQWIFRHKSKLLFYHKMLNSLKSTLACLLATLNLQCSSNVDSAHAEILRMQLENATSAVNHILDHSSSIQLLENNYREMLNRRVTSTGSDLSTGYIGDDTVQPKQLQEQFGIVGVGRRRLDSYTFNDDDSLNETLDRDIDEDLDGDLRGASGRKAVALYEDIRVSQRQVLKLKDEIATSSFARSPSPTPLQGGQLSATSDSNHTPDQSSHTSNPNDQNLRSTRQHSLQAAMEVKSTFDPYVSIRHSDVDNKNKAFGKSLRELRQTKKILLEDTIGDIHYLPLQLAADWESLRRFIRDLYGYGSFGGPPYPLTPEGEDQRLNIEAASTISAQRTYYKTYHFARTPKVSFESEYGVAMTGDAYAYKKMAIQRAIDADEYHLEDPSGNSDHIGGAFRRDNWHERTWLNAHLVLRFNNDYFNCLVSVEEGS